MLKPATPSDTIEDEVFSATLSETEYRDAATIERMMFAAGTSVTLATIRERMAEFVAYTDYVKANGDSWRLALSKTKTYDVVLADPAWSYYGDQTKPGAAAKFYPTMTDEELLAFPIEDYMHDKSILFMWATAPRLDFALECLRARGLHYRGIAWNWIKTKADGTPVGAQGVRPSIVKPTVEYVIAASRQKTGRPLPLCDETIRNTIFAPKTEHSRKPDDAHEFIERMYPDASKIELFARRHRDGWDAWGNEVPDVVPVSDIPVDLPATILPVSTVAATVNLQRGDCLDLLRKLPDGSIDLAMLDLPYQTTRMVWDKLIPWEPLWAELRRVLTPTGTAIAFGSQPFTTDLIMSARDLFRYACVWEKNRAADFLHAKNRVMKTHEDVIVFSKGVMAHEGKSVRRMTYNPQGLEDGGFHKHGDSTTQRHVKICGPKFEANACEARQKNYPRSVLSFPKDGTLHPTQKPVALLTYLINTYSNPGDIILDPSMGSGSAGVAALGCGRHFVGFEPDPAFFEIAEKRVADNVRGSTATVDENAQAVALDQYFTKPELAKRCVEIVERECGLEGRQVVEPSAGTGSFLRFLPPDTIAVDLDPKAKGITKQDFLAFDVESERDIITIGNPPFGKNSLLAVAFFNHAAKMSKTVAFIVPRTFRKASVVNRLHRNFHLVFEEACPPDSFIFCGKPYDVPCVFQIWERRDEERAAVALPTRHPDFEFAPKEHADFAIQRVGMGAGSIKTKFKRCAQSSHYFVRARVPTVFDRLGLIDFDCVKHDTVGNPSVSKRELIALYEATRTL